MRTTTNAIVTNRNVFGFGQDRVVSHSNGSCAYAAQHLALWHAQQRALATCRGLKRRGAITAAKAGAGPMAKPMCLASMGPDRQPVRRTSRRLVTA